MLFLEHFSDKCMYVNIMTNLLRFRGLGCPILGHTYNIYIYIIALIVHDIITNYVTPKLLEHLEWDDGQTSRNPIFNGEKYGFNMLKNRIQSIHPSPSGVRRHVRPGEPAELS
jgi:hypothetical protein